MPLYNRDIGALTTVDLPALKADIECRHGPRDKYQLVLQLSPRNHLAIFRRCIWLVSIMLDSTQSTGALTELVIRSGAFGWYAAWCVVGEVVILL